MSVLLEVEVMDQPTPPVSDGGDCFACAVGAALRHSYPEAEIDFDYVSNLFLQDNGLYNSTWLGVKKALYTASEAHPLQVRADIPRTDFDPTRWPHAWFRRSPGSTLWSERLEAWLAAGWIALSAIHMDGAPHGVAESGGLHVTDHFVLFDGVRRKLREVGEGASKVVHEIHVVDSSTNRPDYRWQDAKELLRDHGAAGWWLVRRDGLRRAS